MKQKRPVLIERRRPLVEINLISSARAQSPSGGKAESRLQRPSRWPWRR
jgi:hypothetical protein